MANFVNRERELRALDRACGQDGGLAVVSGRRRVGKTALIDQFARERRAIFLPGTRAPVGEALRRLEDRIRGVLPPRPGDLLDLGHLPSWDAALGYLVARASEEPLVLVLDEFPYLCEADATLPSTVQARWDHRGNSSLSLVLAGSHVGLMEELVAADAPLFGRADAHLRLLPFTWREARLLVGGDDPTTWLEAFCTVGGMPRYLSLWDPRADLLTNLTELLDGPGAPLSEEGTVVLQELTPGSAAARVLEMVALGAYTFSAIRDRTGLAPASTSDALALLEALGLVDRMTPVGEDARRTRRVRYEVRDAFLRLWLARLSSWVAAAACWLRTGPRWPKASSAACGRCCATCSRSATRPTADRGGRASAARRSTGSRWPAAQPSPPAARSGRPTPTEIASASASASRSTGHRTPRPTTWSYWRATVSASCAPPTSTTEGAGLRRR
jgi:hypothetical protein